MQPEVHVTVTMAYIIRRAINYIFLMRIPIRVPWYAVRLIVTTIQRIVMHILRELVC